VAGVGGGVGTTTLAVAVRGTDHGIFSGHAVDVLVCRSTVESVARAARAAQLLSTSQPRPVLAVTATDSARPSRALLARLRLLEPHAAGVVLLPYVPQWRTLTAPLDSVRGMFARPTVELPRPLRSYVSAVGQLETALRFGNRPPTASRSEPPTLLHAGKERLR
jgi:hypothetical protein